MALPVSMNDLAEPVAVGDTPLGLGSQGSLSASRARAKHWERLPGSSPAMQQLEEAISRVASFECPVLVTGETGCGKEEIARAIHAASPRRDKPFVTVNCGGVVASLAESQLFGHEKGAFTGAMGSARGVFRTADGGVVMLDEIGELPREIQSKLLRVLQRGEVTPVGSTETFHVDVVVIAATHRDIEADVGSGLFREDLLYRLNTIHLKVPPLRARSQEIPRFIEHFSTHFARIYDRPIWQPNLEVLAQLIAYSWPGNIRQLAQTIQRLYVFHDRVEDVLNDLLKTAPTGAEPPAPLPFPPPCPFTTPPPSTSVDPANQAMPTMPAGLPTHRALASAPPIAGLTVAAEPSRPVPADEQVPTFNLNELKRLAVQQALAVTGGHRGRAAQLLGVSANRMSTLAAEACPKSIPRTGRRRTKSPPKAR